MTRTESEERGKEIHRKHAGEEVTASALKNAWHHHLDRVEQTRTEIVVTRYGRPVARLVPYDAGEEAPGIFGCLADTVTEHGDITLPVDEAWDADV